MQLRPLALAALLATAFSAQADTIALWDFNTYTCVAPCSTLPKATQTANGGNASVLGSPTFNSATGVTGSAISTVGYPSQGVGDLSAGVQFMFSTEGYTDLVLTFAQRNSSTASSYTALQYTTDGSTWTTATTFQMPVPSNPSNISFVSGLTFDFSGISAVNNNADFGIRFVATFAPGTSTYLSTVTRLATDYRSTGTVRFDNVLMTGDPLPDLPIDPAPIPEPQTYALMLAGLAAVGLMARRRAR
jgi:hypothetical protein